MRLVKLLFVSLILVAISVNLSAQGKRDHHDWDKFRAEKVSFLTSKLELTPEEAQKFWPVYNLFEKGRSEAHRSRRDIEKQFREENGNLSDKEIIKLIDKMVGISQSEADLMKKYNKELQEVLPPRKVLILYNMESEFRMFMLKKYRPKESQ